MLFECKSSDALYHDISSCVTTKIMVKSKRTKKKGPRPRSRSKSGTKARKRKRESKIKKQSPSLTPSDIDSDALSDRDLDSDDVHNEPLRKKRRQSHRGGVDSKRDIFGHSMNPMVNGNSMDHQHAQFVPPALTGILPSIRPGALPRIGHDGSAPFGVTAKWRNGVGAPPQLDADQNGDGSGGSVLGRMFSWCELARFVMSRMEWSHCGFEWDEATASVDTLRPLYRCSFCLRYRNEAGWGEHAPRCQLFLALKEYEERVKRMHSEWKYQLHRVHNKEDGGDGAMTAMEQQSPPPPPPPQSVAVGHHHDLRQQQRGRPQQQPPSSGTLWSFQYQSTKPLPAVNGPAAHSMPFGGHQPMAGLGGYGMPSNNLSSNNMPPNNLPSSNVPAAAAVAAGNGAEDVKAEKVPFGGGGSGGDLDGGNGIALPSMMPRIVSVSRVHSDYGFDAFDSNQHFLGSFDGAGSFLEAERLNENGRYRPTFDPDTVLSRATNDDDFGFYDLITNSILHRQHAAAK